MYYNPKDGHRIKEPQAYVSWVHSELRISDFHLKQCFFGEYLLSSFTCYPVCIVACEKSVLIVSHFMPDCVWLATGGKHGCWNSNAVQVLKGKDVTLVPDLGATLISGQESYLCSSLYAVP